jgi:hypothetical protein
MGHAPARPATRTADDRLMALWARYRDDRGQPLRTGYLKSAKAARRAVAGTRSIAAAMWRLYAYEVVFWLGFAVLMTAWMAIPQLLQGSLPIGVSLPLTVAILLVLVFALGPWLGPMRFRLHRRGWLALGFCPSCGFEVTPLEPQADACRVCPECEAAWSLDCRACGYPLKGLALQPEGGFVCPECGELWTKDPIAARKQSRT